MSGGSAVDARALRHAGAVREVAVRGEGIRLGQLLKLADVVASGSDAKALLAAGGVRVNGEPERRRGRQVRRGDVVGTGDQEFVVI